MAEPAAEGGAAPTTESATPQEKVGADTGEATPKEAPIEGAAAEGAAAAGEETQGAAAEEGAAAAGGTQEAAAEGVAAAQEETQAAEATGTSAEKAAVDGSLGKDAPPEEGAAAEETAAEGTGGQPAATEGTAVEGATGEKVPAVEEERAVTGEPVAEVADQGTAVDAEGTEPATAEAATDGSGKEVTAAAEVRAPGDGKSLSTALYFHADRARTYAATLRGSRHAALEPGTSIPKTALNTTLASLKELSGASNDSEDGPSALLKKRNEFAAEFGSCLAWFSHEYETSSKGVEVVLGLPSWYAELATDDRESYHGLWEALRQQVQDTLGPDASFRTVELAQVKDFVADASIGSVLDWADQDFLGGASQKASAPEGGASQKASAPESKPEVGNVLQSGVPGVVIYVVAPGLPSRATLSSEEFSTISATALRSGASVVLTAKSPSLVAEIDPEVAESARLLRPLAAFAVSRFCAPGSNKVGSEQAAYAQLFEALVQRGRRESDIESLSDGLRSLGFPGDADAAIQATRPKGMLKVTQQDFCESLLRASEMPDVIAVTAASDDEAGDLEQASKENALENWPLLRVRAAGAAALAAKTEEACLAAGQGGYGVVVVLTGRARTALEPAEYERQMRAELEAAIKNLPSGWPLLWCPGPAEVGLLPATSPANFGQQRLTWSMPQASTPGDLQGWLRYLLAVRPAAIAA